MSSSVAAERASIESVIGGVTLIDVMERNVAAYPDEPALHWRETGGWRSLDWTGYRTAAREAAAGFISLGWRRATPERLGFSRRKAFHVS